MLLRRLPGTSGDASDHWKSAGLGCGDAVVFRAIASVVGIGDLADLSDMAAWFGREHGASFMLVNPLHACAPTPGMEPSPYLPVTRRYVNPVPAG